MKNFWNYVIVIAVIGIFLELLYIANQPCTLSFEVHKGMNFNQPYPTYHHCGLGSNYPILVK